MKSASWISVTSLMSGIPYFDINQNKPTKKLKTESAKRKIPMHTTLVTLGLLDYVEWVRRLPLSKSDGRVFFELPFAKDRGYQRNVGRWWNETFLENLGVTAKKFNFTRFGTLFRKF